VLDLQLTVCGKLEFHLSCRFMRPVHRQVIASRRATAVGFFSRRHRVTDMVMKDAYAIDNLCLFAYIRP